MSLTRRQRPLNFILSEFHEPNSIETGGSGHVCQMFQYELRDRFRLSARAILPFPCALSAGKSPRERPSRAAFLALQGLFGELHDAIPEWPMRVGTSIRENRVSGRHASNGSSHLKPAPNPRSTQACARESLDFIRKMEHDKFYENCRVGTRSRIRYRMGGV
jgi:hypothetical protein